MSILREGGEYTDGGWRCLHELRYLVPVGMVLSYDATPR